MGESVKVQCEACEGEGRVWGESDDEGHAEPINCEGCDGTGVRRKHHRRIGGTDAPKLMGMSKYGGPTNVYARIVLGEQNDIDPFTAMRGQLLEPVIRELSRVKYGWELDKHPGIIMSPDLEWCASSPDDLLKSEDAGIDYKSVDPRGFGDWGDENTDQVPTDYLIQCTHYMAALDRPRWYVCAYFGGNDLRRYVIERDPELEHDWKVACSDFWQRYVVTKTPPPPDDTASYGEWLVRKYKSNGTTVTAGPDAEEWAKRLSQTKEQIKALEEQEREATNHLQALLGEGERLRGDGWLLRYQERSSTSWKGICEEVGVPQDLVTKYTNKTRYPMFRQEKRK